MTRAARAARIEETEQAEEFDNAKRRTIKEKPAPRVQRVATGYIHTTNPDGVDVVFIPGEALPDWVPDDTITEVP